MRILNIREVHFQPMDMRFGPSKVKTVLAFLIFVGGFSIPVVMMFQDREWGMFALFSVVLLMIIFFLRRQIIDAFKNDHWKIVAQNSSILLKGDTVGKGSQDVLEIQFREIESLRKLCERYIRYKGGRNKTKPVRFDSLDIQLTPDAYIWLTRQLGPETAALKLTAPDRFLCQTGIFMLNTNKLIKNLQRYCQVQKAQVVFYDMPDLKDRQQVNDYILFLARRGHDVDARFLAEDAFGLGFRESGKYISDLMKNQLPNTLAS